MNCMIATRMIDTSLLSIAFADIKCPQYNITSEIHKPTIPTPKNNKYL